MMRTFVSLAARGCVGALALMLAALATPASADPPSRVIRISLVQGPVSFAAAGSDDWVFATVNRPVFYGDRLWADEDGRGELEIGNGTLWMGPRTAVDVLNLDDRAAQFQLSEGDIVLRVRDLGRDDTIEIDTPNLAFVVTSPGRYRVSVDAQGQSTAVAVTDGAADVYGEQASYVVTRGQRYRFSGTDLENAERIAPSPPDTIDRFALDRERRHDRIASVRYVSPDVIGVEDLDTYGSWSSVADYGNVWVPREVPADWAPYRNGHWTWIDPWGWTWVDDAPWGFAPFHYGRWAYAQNRWCWVPGPRDVRPVYAPALVAWFGGGGVSISVSSGPAIGWVPLAPREVYRPWYDASPQYIRQVNVSNTHITNVTVINQVINNPGAVTQVNQLVNLRAPRAITAVPPAAFAQGQSVSRVAVAVQANALNRASFQPAPRIAPAREALVGSGQAARGRPPAQVMQRTIVARTAPPPAAMPVQQKIQLLEKDPGKPLAPRQAARTAQGSQPNAASPAGAPVAAEGRPSNVRVARAAKPAATAAPPVNPRAAATAAQPEREGPAAATPPASSSPSTAAGARRPGGPAATQPPREEANAPRAPREATPGSAPRTPIAESPREEARRVQGSQGSQGPQGPPGPRDQARGTPAPEPEREARPRAASPSPAAAPNPGPRPPNEAARAAPPTRAPEAAVPAAPPRAREPAAPRGPEAAPQPPREERSESPRPPQAGPRAREEARIAPPPPPAAAPAQREAGPRSAPAPQPPAAPGPREAARATGAPPHPQPAQPQPQAAREAQRPPQAHAAPPPNAPAGRPGERRENEKDKDKDKDK